MRRVLRSQTTYVWVVLSALTVLAWWLGAERGGSGAGRSVAVTAAVLALGLVKVRCVLRYFMEVRTAPRWLRLSTDGWLLVLWGSMLALYLAA
ncbi:MAG TPA: cytochrome C oxidase subunit IV family protein [Rugosimonospora sp.]|nr:cytochrome C oxidase subunit IV family protein [Rugosimonospora sp.]